MATEQLSALLRADPHLSKFDPLSRIICYDDFSHGLQGWTALIGNYEDSLDRLLPGYRDLRPPTLSNLTAWDTGTAGSLSGTYAMKLATRPTVGSLAVAIKRLTFRHAGPIRLETYFTFKPEASELRLSETDVRAVGILFDLQESDTKAHRQGWSASCPICATSTHSMEQRSAAGNTRRTACRCTTSAEPARPARTSTSRRKGGWTCPRASNCSATTRSPRNRIGTIYGSIST